MSIEQEMKADKRPDIIEIPLKLTSDLGGTPDYASMPEKDLVERIDGLDIIGSDNLAKELERIKSERERNSEKADQEE